MKRADSLTRFLAFVDLREIRIKVCRRERARQVKRNVELELEAVRALQGQGVPICRENGDQELSYDDSEPHLKVRATRLTPITPVCHVYVREAQQLRLVNMLFLQSQGIMSILQFITVEQGVGA